jgi:bifunctional oligoribonuclease and PAP phosphatase NrnA
MTDPRRHVIDVLSRSERVLVTTHVRPDGDALGTAAAMVLGLRKRAIPAEVLLLSHLPRKYAFVFTDNDVAHTDVESGWPNEGSGFGLQGSEKRGPASGPLPNLDPRTLNPFFQRFDTLLVVDTGTWGQLPGLRERIEGWKVPKLVVDHHLTQQDWADVKLVVPEAAAAGEIAADLLDAWQVPFDGPIASALFLAIASDTGWFQFSNTRPQTLRLAARLMEAGVSTDRMYQALYQNERAERVALHTRGQQSLELLLDGRLAVIRLRKRDFEETNASVLDTENLINVPLQIRTVEVSMLIVEPKDFGPVRVSLRSKGGVDVARFAETFGGGGHARASGLKLEDVPFEQAHDAVVSALVQWVQAARLAPAPGAVPTPGT